MKTEDKADDIIKTVLEAGSISSGLDLGAGDCKYSMYLSKRGAKMDAVDLKDRPQSIDGYKDINYTKSDVRSFDLSDKQYDIILLRSVLHYLTPNDAEELLKKIKGHINKDGFVYIFTMTPPLESDRFLYAPETITKILSPFTLTKKEELRTPEEGQSDRIHYSWRLLYRNP